MKDEYRDDLPDASAEGKGTPGQTEGKSLEELQSELAKRMKAIASDLWGGISGTETRFSVPGEPDRLPQSPAEAAGGAPTAGNAPRGLRTATSTGKRPEEAGKRPQSAGKAPAARTAAPGPKKPDRPDIEHLWQQADETVDWTEALGRARPADGLTPEKKWAFYHRMAPKVLEGNLEAYVEVLTTTNPLGDLTDYVNGMVIRTPNPDRLECRFECREELMEDNPRLYLTALSLRIARDLFAALPVSEVYVEGNLKEVRRLGVIWRRAELLNKNPYFMDPVAMAEQAGAALNL